MRMWGKGNPYPLFVGVQTGIATLETNLDFSQKSRNRTAIWLSCTSTGHTTSQLSVLIRRHMYIHVHCCHNSQEMEPTELPINWWEYDKNLVHTNNEILFRCKENYNYEVFRKMDGTGNYYSEWCNSDLQYAKHCVFRRKFTSGTVNMVKPMTGKITGPRGASVSVMLNAVKLLSKHFCL